MRIKFRILRYSLYACSIAPLLMSACGSPPQGETSIAALQATQSQLLAEVRREIAFLPKPEKLTSGNAEVVESQMKKRAQLLRQLEEIEVRINAEGPLRSRYVTDGMRDPVLQAYYNDVVRRVKEEGERDFPKAEGQSLYGQMNVLLTVSARGKVEQIEILKSTSPRLSEHSTYLLRRLEPYQPTPSGIDQLVIQIGLNYTSE